IRCGSQASTRSWKRCAATASRRGGRGREGPGAGERRLFGIYSLAAPLCYILAKRDVMASSIPFEQDPDPYADRRVYPRVPVALPAFLQAGGKRHSVQVLDLSAGGAKLNCAISLASGTAVLLDCGTLR